MEIQERYSAWLNSEALSSSEKAELKALADNAEEIKSRFFSQLEFGTAGLRGVMGVGLNRMNVHVIRHATQAFAEVILEDGGDGKKSVVICFDCRDKSPEFAQEAASVMAANSISVLIFDALRPTPELSFAIREYGCTAGINVTASHNTSEYNGYKVYWSDGAQLPPVQAASVAEKMAQLDMFAGVKRMDYGAAVEKGLVHMLGRETDELFLKNVMGMANDFEAVAAVAEEFKVVYTPFHGAGYILVPEALRRLGVKNLYCVPEQMITDGNFPTVESPNPENPEGFALAVKLADEKGADLIIGTDPDSDRVGIMVRDNNGAFVPITGNQTGVLLLDYLIGAKKRAGTMPERPVALKTIVSTEMVRRVANENGVQCVDTFTGFKFMAEEKNRLEAAGEGKVIFSFEESYGYMLGDYVRDKDAVSASLLLAEMAAWYFGKGMTLFAALEQMFEKYGCHMEETINIYMPGLDGLKKMQDLMDSLRNTPPESIASVGVVSVKDYLTGEETNLSSGAKTKIEPVGSNVLRFELTDATSILIRPSGTEPKIKVYILASGCSKPDCEDKVKKYSDWAEKLNGQPDME